MPLPPTAGDVRQAVVVALAQDSVGGGADPGGVPLKLLTGYLGQTALALANSRESTRTAALLTNPATSDSDDDEGG
jgi:hypothetical protein